MSAKAAETRVARTRLRQLDNTLKKVNVPTLPRPGWLRTVREVLGMNQRQLATRLGMSAQGISSLERKEVQRRITIATLDRVAQALDCHLVYTLVPNTSLADTISTQSLRKAAQMLDPVNTSQSLEGAQMTGDQLARAQQDLALELEINRPKRIWD